jgi:hypothetical protein
VGADCRTCVLQLAAAKLEKAKNKESELVAGVDTSTIGELPALNPSSLTLDMRRTAQEKPLQQMTTEELHAKLQATPESKRPHLLQQLTEEQKENLGK